MRTRGPFHALTSPLEQGVLESERLRSAIIAGLALLIAAALLVSHFTAPARFAAMFSAPGVGTTLPLLFLGIAVYEIAFTFLIRHLIARGEALPLGARYANVVLEIAAIAWALWLVGRSLPLTDALNLPPTHVLYLLIALSALRLSLPLSLWTGVVSGLAFVGMALALLGPRHPEASQTILLPELGRGVIYVLAGLVTGIVARRIRVQLGNLLRSQEDRRRALSVFGQHVSPAVAQRLLESGGVDRPEVRRVAVLFLDIRGFTAWCEPLPPSEVLAVLNRLFAPLVRVVEENGGIINKFLGDGFMAVFGAPAADPHAPVNAVRAALAIDAGLTAAGAGGTLPALRVGMGVHAGDAITGSVGSETRREFTVLGDVVNLASRLETLNKEVGSTCLLSSEVVRSLGELEPTLAARASPLGARKIRGREREVEIYRLL